MIKLTKIFTRFFFTLITLIPLAAFAHYIIFPQETRSILIDYSGFKKDGRLYFEQHAARQKIDTLKSLVAIASVRVADFWKQKLVAPKFIYCDKAVDFNKYSIAPAAPAVTYCKLGSYIVVSRDGLDMDIIAHEISHAALFQRIGFFNRLTKIPTWFDEGLAMQNDYRSYYSEDTFRLRSNNYKNMPDIKKTSAAQFNLGSLEQVMLNYMTAKHLIKKWYSKEKLEAFIKALNAGKSFDEAYGE